MPKPMAATWCARWPTSTRRASGTWSGRGSGSPPRTRCGACAPDPGGGVASDPEPGGDPFEDLVLGTGSVDLHQPRPVVRMERAGDAPIVLEPLEEHVGAVVGAFLGSRPKHHPGRQRAVVQDQRDRGVERKREADER